MRESDLFEDLLGLSRRYGPWPVKRQAIASFAGATGETNPIYFDPGAAWSAGHRDVVAPRSFFTSLLLPESESAFRPDTTLFTIFGGQSIRFHEDIYAGDVIEARSEVVDIFRKTGRSGTLVFVVIEAAFRNQEQRFVVEVLSTMIYRLSEGEPAAE